MELKRHIPNGVTLLNLLSGLFSIYFATRGSLQLAGLMIFFAAFFDFFDGFAARLLHAKSAIGVQLDSLADMVSFGVAPAFVLFYTMRMPEVTNGESATAYLAFSAFIIPLFSALRLAKFNIDDEQTTSFKGLPTPATALLFASFPLMILVCLAEHKGFYYHLVTNIYFLAGTAFLVSFLMVSKLPMFSLKFTSLPWSENQTRYIFILLSIVLLALLKAAAIPLIFVLYLLLSVAAFVFDNKEA